MKVKTISPVISHVYIVILAYYLMHHWGLVNAWPTQDKLLAWDAMWYNSIQSEGYIFVPFKTCSLAFFPMFPIVWATLNVSSQLISIYNLVIFATAIHFILKGRCYPLVLKFLILSTPSFLFFALPYSEALFFVFGTLLVVAYEQNHTLLRLGSFFFLSLSRAVAVIFIPALIFSEFLSSRTNSFREKIKNLLLNIVACGFGLFLAAYIQFYQTGKWFYFIEIQRFWKRGWVLPKFPFRTYREEEILSIDGIAVVVGMVAIWVCCTWVVRAVLKFNKGQGVGLQVKQQVIFSAAVISTTTVIDICFTNLIENGANIWSINRHILCSPFYILFLLWLYKDFKPSRLEQWSIGMLLIGGIYLTGVFAYPIHLAFYILFFASFIALKYFPRYIALVWICYLTSSYFQLTFYSDFLNYKWIG